MGKICLVNDQAAEELEETPFGVKKRLKYFEEILRSREPEQVLDVGCGTGEQVTIPLAKNFPKIQFLGVDTDESSVMRANRGNELKNLRFECIEDIGKLEPETNYDIIVASEVIEHVENPAQFMAELKKRLSGDGALILTLPNGYGPYELIEVVRTVLHVTGLYEVLRKVKYTLSKSPPPSDENPTLKDSCANSPHINFFSYPGIKKLIREVGFEFIEYKPRTFLCGFLLSGIVTRYELIKWNTKVADSLPPRLNSGWMFLLEQANSSPGCSSSYEPSTYSKVRRYLNRKKNI